MQGETEHKLHAARALFPPSLLLPPRQHHSLQQIWVTSTMCEQTVKAGPQSFSQLLHIAEYRVQKHLGAHLHQHPPRKRVVLSPVAKRAGYKECLWKKAGIFFAVPGITLTYSCCQSCHLLIDGKMYYIISPIALTLHLRDSSAKYSSKSASNRYL